MNERFYSTTAHHFSTPDILIPDETNPQDYNRYAYAGNNPLRYRDPSGHVIEEIENGGAYDCEDYYECNEIANDPRLSTIGDSCGPYCTVSVDNTGRHTASYEELKFSRRVIDPVKTTCTSEVSLVDCYMNSQIRLFDEGEDINIKEFTNLLNIIAYDVHHSWTPPGLLLGYYAGRGVYDTPFYNGYGYQEQVCIDGLGCWHRSEVNYIAQGMWAAASGTPLDVAIDTTIWWNEFNYNHPPTQGELFWTEFGYIWYQNWLENME